MLETKLHTCMVKAWQNDIVDDYYPFLQDLLRKMKA